MTNPIPARYQRIVQTIRDTFVETGGKLMYKPEDFGLNEFYPSRDGKTLLVFDYGSIHELVTPEGTITPIGSCVMGNSDRCFELLVERLGLVVVKPQRDDSKTDYLSFQLRESGPTMEVTKLFNDPQPSENQPS